MLKKRNRLSRREFAHLLKHGRRVHGEGVTVVYEKLVACSLQLVGTNDRPSYQATQLSCPQTNPPAGGQAVKLSSLPALRAGVVVGKKVARNAVDRNKLRRVIYGILGEVLVRGSVDQPPPPNLLTGAVHSSGLLHRSSQNTSTSLAPCPQHGSPLVKGEGTTAGLLPLPRGGLRWGGVDGSETASTSQPLHIAILTRPKARTMTTEEMRKEIQELLARCGEGNEKCKTPDFRPLASEPYLTA